MPIKIESSFASLRGCLSESDVSHYLEEHYFFLFAHTNSCARPTSSSQHTFRYFDRSLLVAVSPCRILAHPDFISAFLGWMLGPLPRGVSSVILPGSSQTTSASRSFRDVRNTHFLLLLQLQQGTSFEAAVIPLCSGSHARQAPSLLPPHPPNTMMGRRVVYATQ